MDQKQVFFDLVDKPHVYAFYGVYNNCFKLGDVIFEAIEDPDDGYRSFLETITISSDHGIFSKRPLAYVQIRTCNDSDYEGYCLYSPETNHQWLWVGTENTHDYYPYFSFTYTPDKNQTTFPETNLCPKQLYPEYFI